jgi:hypothetical protein
MNITIAECNACKAAGATTTTVNGSTGWYRLGGLYEGTPSLPLMQSQSRLASGQLVTSQIQPIDICPACAAKLGIPALKAAVTPAGAPTAAAKPAA